VSPRQSFVRRWKAHVAGTIALGNARARVILVGSFNGGSTAERFLSDLESVAEAMLGKIYDDLIQTQAEIFAGAAKSAREGLVPTAEANGNGSKQVNGKHPGGGERATGPIPGRPGKREDPPPPAAAG
jgi:hypothetical protein